MHIDALSWLCGTPQVMKEQTLVSMAIAASMVFVICLILLGSVSVASLVFLMVILTDLAILAGFTFIGLNIEFVSCLVLVLAIGFSVDYSAHIAHAFIHSTSVSGDECARDALAAIGKSVLCGGFSTWLAVMLLPLSHSYLFAKVLFWSITFTVFFGLFFGVVVLPVLLSLFYDCTQAHCGGGDPKSDATAAGGGGSDLAFPDDGRTARGQSPAKSPIIFNPIRIQPTHTWSGDKRTYI